MLKVETPNLKVVKFNEFVEHEWETIYWSSHIEMTKSLHNKDRLR